MSATNNQALEQMNNVLKQEYNQMIKGKDIVPDYRKPRLLSDAIDSSLKIFDQYQKKILEEEFRKIYPDFDKYSLRTAIFAQKYHSDIDLRTASVLLRLGQTERNETINFEEYDKRVYLSEKALKEIIRTGEFSIKNGKNYEVMGLLLGDVHLYKGKSFSIIKDAIVDTEPDSTDVSVKFTKDSFIRMFAQMGKLDYDYLIMGWYHTHPGHTCFLSETDLRTHETMFNKPYQTAFVYDPINMDIRGFRHCQNKVDYNKIIESYFEVPWSVYLKEQLPPPPED